MRKCCPKTSVRLRSHPIPGHADEPPWDLHKAEELTSTKDMTEELLLSSERLQN
jgi:hypothetical protein